ncbi:MAG TPA: prepilin-type N-terminal cleavage/methylation domain-containing protein [Candidatus Saccharimonadales bacterium]|nr:prepilin-type N-terminal cleavage/methylation domain-containing protein [Candidatus Saccharimonadales bacterium]
MRKPTLPQDGFTLLELAVVIVCVVILLELIILLKG